MADHNKPTVTSNYLDFVSEMHGRMDDLAVGLDPERTSATNVPNYSIRWSSVAKKWQYLDGSSWKDLTNEYAINISGSAAKLKNARTISITGGGTAQPVPFDGSADVQLTLESLDLANLTGLGSAATRDVGTSSGNVLENGAFGLGNVRKINDNSVATRFAYYAPGTQPPGYPSGWYGYGAMWSIYHGYSGDVAEFILTHTNNSTFAFRHSRDGAWREIYHTGNTHTHPWSQITGAPATATRWPTWAEVSGKPSGFTPPTTHGAVGTYAIVIFRSFGGRSEVNWGGTIAGSNLAPWGMVTSTSPDTYSPALSGTWRIMGSYLRRTEVVRNPTLAVRIS